MAGTTTTTFLRGLALLLTLAAPSTHAHTYATRFPGVTWASHEWTLATTVLDQGHYQARMSLANGYLGINVAAAGPFFEVDTPVNGDMISGWPLFSRRQTFATISGFWDAQPTTNGTNFAWLNQYGGESVIAGVPHWAGLVVQAANGAVLDAAVDKAHVANFSSSVCFKTGVMSWAYTWTPGGDVSAPLAVEYTMLVHKLHVNQAAVQLRLTALAGSTNVTVTDVLEGDCAVRTDFADKGSEKSGSIFTAVRPVGISNVTAYIYSTLVGDGFSETQVITESADIGRNQSSIAQAAQLTLSAGTATTITKYIGGASTDAFADPQSVARTASSSAAAAGFASLLQAHAAEWASILTPDSVDSYAFANGTLSSDPYIVEQQITSVTNPFQLLQNTIGTNALAAAGNNNSMLNVNSISVGGLGSDSYAGLVFWDADVWMAPGLLVAFPEAAEAIANYRVRLFPQARENVAMAFSSSQNKTGKFTVGAAAVFPWTSGRFGNCTGTGPCFDYEYHINGDIGIELFNIFAVTGDTATFSEKYFPIYDGIATFYSELVDFNETSGTYTLSNATDPDEYANFVNNPGFTMALMKTHLAQANSFRTLLSQPPNLLAANASSSMEIPTDAAANLILEYATMNGSISVKQADVVLIDDFLNYPNQYTLSNLDYYAGKQSDAGPGMTYGVFSIIANAFAPSGCASWTYGVNAAHPYLRAPWFQFSEQLQDDFATNGGTHPAYPFLTGTGGAHRVAIFGYLGLKLRLDALNIDPSLPPQIPHLDYRTFYWQGHAINATSNTTHTTLARIPSLALAAANPAYLTAAIPITIGSNATAPAYHLGPADTIVLRNRGAAAVKTWAGNLAQCVPATSAAAFAPGQFPFAANDGAVSTKWEPAAADAPSSVTVDLGDAGAAGPRVSALRFDWAQAPPRRFSVAFANSTDAGAAVVNVTSSESVAISNPYDAASVSLIRPYASNTTNVTLSEATYAGRYAILTIQGNQEVGDDGIGASVAEFAVII